MAFNYDEPRYSEEMIQDIEEWDRQYIWHPFTQMQDYVKEPPLIFSHGEGAYLFDINGRCYFDGNSSLWVNLHGHRHCTMISALKNQVDELFHSTLLGAANEPSIELAQQLVEIAPPGLEKVFYSDNGSTAVEVALKMAFQYWQQAKPPQPKRTTFISFRGAYHGDTIGCVSVGGIDLFHAKFGSLLFKCYHAPYPVYSKYPSIGRGDSRIAPTDIASKSLDECEKLLKEHEGEIAAVIIEPLVQGAAGIKTQAPGFLKGLRELCDRYDVFLIADEVFTGFGHTGKMFACEHEGVSPDFMALAKGITGGSLPLAATLTSQRVYDGFLGEYSEFRTFFHGHTYTGNPLACAAALANLDIFERESTLSWIQPVISHLEKRLDQLFEASDQVADIHQCGLIAGIDIARSRSRQEFYKIEERMGAKVCLELRKYGIWLRPLGNTLVLVPPLISSIKQIDYLMDAIESCLK